MISDKKIRRAAVYEHFLRWHITDDQGKRPPYVIVKSIQLEVTDFGDVFVRCSVRKEDGSISEGLGDHYTRPHVDNLLDPNRVKRLEERLGLDAGYCQEYNFFLDIDPDDDERIQELMVRRCHDCMKALGTYEDVKWRFRQHAIRCPNCANALMQRGESHFDAYYVE